MHVHDDAKWKPKVAIVAVDNVLWPFKLDQCQPPFVNHGDHVEDSNKRKLVLHPEAKECLEALKAACSHVVLSHRTTAPGTILLDLLKAFGLNRYITSAIVDSTPFVAHLEAAKKACHQAAEDVIAFLGDHGAVAEAEAAHAFPVYVSPKTGLTLALVRKAIKSDTHLNAVMNTLMPQLEQQPPQLPYHEEMLEQALSVSAHVENVWRGTTA